MATAENQFQLRHTVDSSPTPQSSGARPHSAGSETGLPSRPQADTSPTADRLGTTADRLGTSADQGAREILKAAATLFPTTGNWVVFFRKILGREGVARTLFSEPADFEQFTKTSEFAEIQEMVAALRSHDASKSDAAEPERMITIRLPMSLHDVLVDEAEELNLSINKLCISKLLQRIEGRFVPVQQGRRRGRKPGPQGPRKKPDDSSPNS